MNILLTCVGRRAYLVRYFREALNGKGLIIAANSEPLTTGMLAADRRYIVPRVNSPDYINRLLAICSQEDVRLLVSLFDSDLPFLAEKRQQFEAIGVDVAVSDPWIIEAANDKWFSFNYLHANHVSAPKTYLDLEEALLALNCNLLRFPVIVKPRFGMGSMSIHKADDYDELVFFHALTMRQIEKSYLRILSGAHGQKTVLIQEFIEGDEYGLDVFNNLHGQHLLTVAKKKLSMRSGETDIAEIVNDTSLRLLGEQLACLLKHRANLDVDVLVGRDRIPRVLEFNARYGGGYPFTHLAGANLTKALVDLVEGKPIDLSQARPGVIGLKDIHPVTFN